MFPMWRLRIREARIAFEEGRWDEASAMLSKNSLRDFLPAKQLSQEIASQLVLRAQDRLDSGDSLRGWSDLEQASRLGGCDDKVAQIRAAQTKRNLDRVRQLLISGETTLAREQIAKLEKQNLGGDERRTWKLIVHLISQARALSEKGEMKAAVEMLERAKKLLPGTEDEISSILIARQAQLEQQAEEVRHLTEKLHSALSRESWTVVLTTADSLLELSPEHTAARQARQKAWQVVGMEATRIHKRPQPTFPQEKRNDFLPKKLASTRVWKSSAKVDTMSMDRAPGKRMLAWIDGVGGYLICMSDEVLIGQPTGSKGTEVPILADLSRRHATIRREGGDYVITPIHDVSLDGQKLSGPSVLTDGALIELGEAVKIRFQKPHALSATGVLTIESHHKTDPAVDRILLMSESCVFGSKSHSHVYCRNWPEDFVLYRRGDDLHFRSSAKVEVDGVETGSGGLIPGTSRIECDYFSMSFEEI